jgi:hypothetical protein
MPKHLVNVTEIIEQAANAAKLTEQLEYTKRDLMRQIVTHDVDGVAYRVAWNGELQRFPKLKMPVLAVATLSGIVDYVQNNPDGLQEADYFVHVVSTNEVMLYGSASIVDKERPLYVHASIADRSKLNVYGNKYLSQDDFGLWLMTCFEKDLDYNYVRNVAGHLKSEKVAESQDNGFGQVVNTRTENKSEWVEVKNPVELAPLRTFPEIAPFREAFAVRLKGGEEGEPPRVGLFEADGGAWKVEIVKRVKDWLAERLTDTPIIG